ncbi:MAG: MBL fold metallo-hydrolase [Promethearchaeota archaeon]|nr:MAG: MBL fold metallo-hydrolase [Candidatus Lokiarchaeota archaeon]
MVRLTILIDDINGVEKDFVKSFGFAALIEKNNKKVLFDAGTHVSPLLTNLKTIDVSPASLDAVILSHNHNDHTDGLPGILRKNNSIPVHVNKDWNVPVSFQGKRIPEKNLRINDNAREVKEITNGIYLTNSYFSSDYGKIYEHACYIKTDNSFILLCGCCHPGLNNFLKDRKQLNIPLDSPLHFIGGMHGFQFTDSQANELSPIVKSVILCHCTMQAKMFREQFGDKCSLGIVGKTMNFPSESPN